MSGMKYKNNNERKTKQVKWWWLACFIKLSTNVKCLRSGYPIECIESTAIKYGDVLR